MIFRSRANATIAKIDFSKIDYNNTLFDQLGVKYIVTDRNLYLQHRIPIFSNNNITIYKNLNAQSRVIIIDAEGNIIEQPTITYEDPNRIEMKVDKPGTLILRDTYYPGGKAYVNDKETEIVVQDKNFRKITVPSKGNVKFVFQPKIFSVGLFISSFSISCALIICLILKIKQPVNRFTTKKK